LLVFLQENKISEGERTDGQNDDEKRTYSLFTRPSSLVVADGGWELLFQTIPENAMTHVARFHPTD
jgi:hypothetical protein